MRKIGFALCLIGFAAAILTGWLAAVHAIGTDDDRYLQAQLEADILGEVGVSEQTLAEIDHALAAYLKGDAHALEALTAEVFGQIQPAFNARELQHMEDCFFLFRLLRVVGVVLGATAIMSLSVGTRLLQNRKRLRTASWIAPLILLVPLGIFALWAAKNFSAAFQYFHEALFTNDLWQLDPSTDLLIRICPESMFFNLGAQIALAGLGAALAVPALATALSFRKERV